MPSFQGSITFTLHFVEEAELIAQRERERIKAESSKELVKTRLELAEAEEAKRAKARANLAAQKAKERENAEKAAQPSLFGKQFATPNPSGTLKVSARVCSCSAPPASCTLFSIKPLAYASLQVHLVSAKGLKAADAPEGGAKKGSSDPYVVVRLRDSGGGASAKQSAAVEKNVNPKFDETLEFDVRDLQNLLTGEASLTFSVYDKNPFRLSAFDTSLGEAILQLAPLDWLRKKLSSPTKKTLMLSGQGSITFTLHFVEADSLNA